MIFGQKAFNYSSKESAKTKWHTKMDLIINKNIDRIPIIANHIIDQKNGKVDWADLREGHFCKIEQNPFKHKFIRKFKT